MATGSYAIFSAPLLNTGTRRAKLPFSQAFFFVFPKGKFMKGGKMKETMSNNSPHACLVTC
jgi:hypothetical protein